MPKFKFLRNLGLVTLYMIASLAVASLGVGFATIVGAMIGEGAIIPALMVYVVLVAAAFLTTIGE